MSGIREKIKEGSITKEQAISYLRGLKKDSPWDVPRINRLERWVINFKPRKVQKEGAKKRKKPRKTRL